MESVEERERKKQNRIHQITVAFILVCGFAAALYRPEVLIPILVITSAGILTLKTLIAMVQS